MSRKKRRRSGTNIGEILLNIFTIFMVITAAAMMVFTIVSVRTFDRNDRDLFGYKAFIVRSDSMKATDFEAGDLVMIQEVDPSTLQAGDIIAFRSTNESNFGETVTHKVRSLTTTDEGEPAFITYGTTTGVDDETPVTYDRVMGKYCFNMPKVGSFFTFLKTVPGYICCILMPFLILLIIQGANSVKLFQQYRKEQLEEIEAKRQKELEALAAERERLAAEREESQRLLAQLREMQSQLNNK